MAISNKLSTGFSSILGEGGKILRIRYWDVVYDDVYDEATNLLQSGNNLWVSGIIFPLDTTEGSTDSILLEQGKLVNSDKKVYVNGSVTFTGSTMKVDVQIGSPTGDLYTAILLGDQVWEVSDISVYKKQYLRKLTGSLI